jgi:predicted Zn-dependent peptidase
MLAARTSTARNVKRIARSFATVVDSAGVKVAAIDHNQSTSSVTLFVKAGSRFEPKEGVANALKNFAFKVSPLECLFGVLDLNVYRARPNARRLEQFGRVSCMEVFCLQPSDGNILR